MADLKDPSINEAYLDVRSDKSDTSWLLLDYESEKSDKLKVTKTGTGDLAELKEALDDSKASYGYARVSYANDKESKREKFILVVWIGPNCKVMRRAKVCAQSPTSLYARLRLPARRTDRTRTPARALVAISVHSADVKEVLRVFSIEVAAREKDDLNQDPIVVRLRKASNQ
ncbi:hypothetical protein D9619_008015 [Psilocybe cf. subviscida]|uniref:ADF-H domain-containing protein n=1 Tax=Psilocybe cf. subviscida TaxID=2480587 RepID=A0A8H5ATD6_9AGAR|nr:hypothetical protein D9619_008015 [Psilocybe cf. subviscida]